MKDEPNGKEMKYASEPESAGNMKRTLTWVLLILVVVVVVVVFFINRRSGSQDAEYMATVDRANTALAMKEYREARKNYMAARMIKPEEELPNQKIAFIDSVLAAVTAIDTGKAAAGDTAGAQAAKEMEKPVKREEVAEGEEKKEKEIPPPPSAKEGKTIEKEPAAEPHYHIIVGSFSVRSNAVNYSRELQEKGVDSRIIPIQNGKLNAVTYGSYKTETEAVRALHRVQREFNEDAWVLKK